MAFSTLELILIFTLFLNFNNCFGSESNGNESTVKIGNCVYKREVIGNFTAINHITVDKNGNIFFKKSFECPTFLWKNGSKEPTQIHWTNAGCSTDTLEDNKGKIYISTYDGIYTFDDEHTGTYYAGKPMVFERIVEARDGMHATSIGDNHHFILDPIARTFVAAPLYNEGSFGAFTSSHAFISSDAENKMVHYMESVGSKKVDVTGLPDMLIHNIVTDRNDEVFICTSNGLYLIDVKHLTASRVENIGEVFSIGYDHSGKVIYLGEKDSFTKLTLQSDLKCKLKPAFEIITTSVKHSEKSENPEEDDNINTTLKTYLSGDEDSSEVACSNHSIVFYIFFSLFVFLLGMCLGFYLRKVTVENKVNYRYQMADNSANRNMNNLEAERMSLNE